MDEKTFHRFAVKIKNLISQQKKIKNIDINSIERILHQLSKNSESVQLYVDVNNENPTIFETPTGCWFPGCFLVVLMCLIVIIIALLQPTSLVQCALS